MATNVNWHTVVRMVADAGPHRLRDKAEEVVDLLRASWRTCAVDALIDAAKQVMRADELRTEREAERQRKGLTAQEWRLARGRERQERQRANVARAQSLGLSPQADPYEVLAAELRSAINTYTSELRLQWTSELLASTFSLKDGAKVTWGAATADQHKERLQIFSELAAVNIEGAARHKAAIDALEESGARCLNEMVLQAA